LRHPGYAADLALWLGFGLASGNAIVGLSVAPAMALAYVRRIDAEEDMLARELGEPYRRYMRESWRVVPWVY
jgi:protein-S-isoprenylcysteine O-methyltransferase Ste14